MNNSFRTHEVINQPYPLPNYNLWSSDVALQEIVHAMAGTWADQQLKHLGKLAGSQQMEHGELANKNKPLLQAFDRYGRRIDQVEFHPSYHEFMKNSMENQVHSFSWNHADRSGAHVVRAALMYINSQADAGTACPLTMTHACIPTLKYAPELAKIWLPKILQAGYDARALPIEQKTACTIGMGMTEKQGGSDVRSNTTQAFLQDEGHYHIVGHKFFFSAPMCDAHLVLAQTERGVSCFLVPRILADGSLNHVRIQRLKDKLGDWSNASSEVEFHHAIAYLVGDEGRGIANILEMVAFTRLDCAIGSAALMRQALVQAIHHTGQRSAFGKLLIDQPLMRNVLADLSLESEAALALSMRVAQAIDSAKTNPSEAAFARIATAVAKFWICKRAPAFVNEAQECLGGIGYVEENILPRLYRQAPLNSIWEGSGNVQCLDVLRAIQKDPTVKDALFEEFAKVQGRNTALDAYVDELVKAFSDLNNIEVRSRLLVERTAIALQATVLLQYSPSEIAEAFCSSRLNPQHGFSFGSADLSQVSSTLIQRATL